MKKNDIASLILIVALCGGASYAVGYSVMSSLNKERSATIETVEVISADVTSPNDRVFNANAINPSVSIKIGDTENQTPFGN